MSITLQTSNRSADSQNQAWKPFPLIHPQMSSFFRRGNDDSTFLKNGAILLEKLIATFNGKHHPFRSFSAEELNLATNNYDKEIVIGTGHEYNLFKGFLKRPVVVMKYVNRPGKYEYCINNIVFASQVCHKNVLKLIGCCLETDIPILVYESVEYCTLAYWIGSPHHPHMKPLLLKHRLKIAMEIANAVAYLHFGFPRPIVFRYLNPSNILLDEHYVAKLYDFSLCESIPEGETHIETLNVVGVYGFMAPEYAMHGKCNEKSDVYSFGALLFVLLTGRKIINLEQEDYINPISKYVKERINNNTLNEIVDPIVIGEESYSEVQQQLQDFMQLISKCLANSAKDRPTMIDVAKHLRQLYMSVV